MDLSYLRENIDVVLDLCVQHLRISLSALAIALPIAVVLSMIGIWLRPVRQPVLWSVGFLYTIPSLAMLAFLIPTQGLGLRPTLILLVIYAQVFLVRNIITGLQGVDPATLEAARGVGMTSAQVMMRVWFPMALPVILAGVRIALVTVIGLAVLGGWVTAGGLGRLLFEGISTDNPAKVIAGVIAIVALALVADVAIRLLQSLTSVSRARRAGARS
jgi:osmoprotectant transport system permease protein